MLEHIRGRVGRNDEVNGLDWLSKGHLLVTATEKPSREKYKYTYI